MSYLYIKNFIEEQIQILNQPLVIDDELRAVMAKNNISEETMKSIVLKANLRLKRYNRSRFNRQAVHQIVQQVVNNEKEKVFKVNEALAKIDMMIPLVLLPEFSLVGENGDRVRMMSELIHELPEPEYLFAAQEFVEEEQGIEAEGRGEEELVGNEQDKPKSKSEFSTDLLVQDDQENLKGQERVEEEQRKKQLDKYHAEVSKELKQHVTMHQQRNRELRSQYTELRRELRQLNEKLVYSLQKLEYLRLLSGKLEFLERDKPRERPDSEEEESEVEDSSIDLKVQMTRFRILMEKLQFAMK